jgi:hypothetical protein
MKYFNWLELMASTYQVWAASFLSHFLQEQPGLFHPLRRALVGFEPELDLQLNPQISGSTT